MEPYRSKRKSFLYWTCATFLVLLWISPILAALLTSVKSLDELNRGEYWTLPDIIYWQNYYDAFVTGGFYKYFINSFVIAVPSVLGVLVLSLANGYALSKLRFKGREGVLRTFLSGMLLPFQILLIPVFYISAKWLHTYDTRFGVILFHIAFQTGFGSFFMRNFIAALPDSMVEAARMDGLKEWQILTKIIAPVTKPALAALATLLFTWIWNDFLWSLILLQSDDLKPVTVALQNLKGQWIASYHLQSAGAIIAAIPPVIVFILLQKHFIKGLTMGSDK